MRFERIVYLDWAKRRLDLEPPAYNLASSGMENAAAADLGLAPWLEPPIAGENVFGHPRLRARLAGLHGVGPERVLTTSGASLANFLVPAALLAPGDRVVCEWPAYEPLWRVLGALGARIRFLPRRPEDGRALDLSELARELLRGARLVVLTDLHNPTAAALDREALSEMGRLAARHDAWVLVDEVYRAGVFGAPLATAAGLGERIVVTSSLTKIFGLSGLRAGWAIAPEEVVRRAQDTNDHLGVISPFMADEAELLALDRLEALRERAALRRAANWPRVEAFLRERRLAYEEPAGAFIVWVRLPDGVAADPLERRLRERYDTQITPGTFFGCPFHVRLGYGGPPEKVAEGLRRLGRALDEEVGVAGSTSPAR